MENVLLFHKTFSEQNQNILRYEKSLGGTQEDAREEALKNNFDDEYDNETHKHSLGNTVSYNEREIFE